MEVVKIVMIGITGVLLALFLKESKPEYSVYLSLVIGICILGYAVGKLSYLFESIKKMGGVKDVIGMMPGMYGMKIKEGDINEELIDKYKAIICSMTKRERDNPDIIKSSRRKRIAAGSGTTIQQVNQLLKQYDQAKAMMKSMKNNKKFRMPF